MNWNLFDGKYNQFYLPKKGEISDKKKIEHLIKTKYIKYLV